TSFDLHHKQFAHNLSDFIITSTTRRRLEKPFLETFISPQTLDDVFSFVRQREVTERLWLQRHLWDRCFLAFNSTHDIHHQGIFSCFYLFVHLFYFIVSFNLYSRACACALQYKKKEFDLFRVLPWILKFTFEECLALQTLASVFIIVLPLLTDYPYHHFLVCLRFFPELITARQIDAAISFLVSCDGAQHISTFLHFFQKQALAISSERHRFSLSLSFAFFGVFISLFYLLYMHIYIYIYMYTY
ncbi:hypothetical protein RFI_14395, partial [Reticulomyxa filosa]